MFIYHKTSQQRVNTILDRDSNKNTGEYLNRKEEIKTKKWRHYERNTKVNLIHQTLITTFYHIT